MSDFRDVLQTVDSRGNRRWVYADVVSGYFHKRRKAVACFLIAIYLLLPWLTVSGQQAVLLDIPGRKFTFFGAVFFATDMLFLFLLLALLGIALFLFTALLGRVWCGWACPETVFLEFVFRPIERWLEGNPSQRLKLDSGPWTLKKVATKAAKYGCYIFICWFLASTALAYFLGHQRLLGMISDWPWKNWDMFLLTLALSGLLVFQFGWFREQFCTILCPYARFQSVLLDSNSLLVGYDKRRGEPRGKLEKGPTRNFGDCIDCGLCQRVCPTGIDIRDGLQLECVQCALCADACDSVMAKIDRPKGLIRYDTESQLSGEHASFMRARVLIYGAIFILLLSLFVYSLANRNLSEFQVLRGANDLPFSILTDQRVSNHLNVHISNKDTASHNYVISLVEPDGVQLVTPFNQVTVQAGMIMHVPVFLNFSQSLLENGKLPAIMRVENEEHQGSNLTLILLGPDAPGNR